MRVSFYTKSQPGNPEQDWTKDNFYGYSKSFIQIKKAFERYQYNGSNFEVLWNDPSCDVQIYFGFMGEESSHHDHQYKIFMSHVESSKLPESRLATFKNLDEFWTGNEWSRSAAISGGISHEKVFTYNLGVDSNIYKPFLRGRKNKIRFLHIGNGWVRKRSDLVLQAFDILHRKYGDSIELTIKDADENNPFPIHNWLQDFVLKNAGEKIAPGVRLIEETLTEEQMVSLLNFHDVLVYPSEGEGFGLIPLEALSTGMPVISTHEWCSYSHFLKDNAIKSKIGPAQTHWGYDMDGDVIIPQLDSIIEQMENVINNITDVSLKYFRQAPAIVEEYSWDKITKKFLDQRIPDIGVEKF